MSGGPYNYNYIFKYIIIGDMGVGKSCLLHHFTEKKCKPIYYIRVISFGHYLFFIAYFIYEWEPVVNVSPFIHFSHGQLPTHNRSGIWNAHYWGGRAKNQVTNMVSFVEFLAHLYFHCNGIITKHRMTLRFLSQIAFLSHH